VHANVCTYIFTAFLLNAMASSSSGAPPAKRLRVQPRGGHLQKARWSAEGVATDDSAKSHLASYLIDRWSWGLMSTPVVQQIAAFAVADGASKTDIVFLSKLGCSGKYPNNMYRELTKKLKDTPLTEAIDNIVVWQKKGSKAAVQVNQKIMLPHQVFASLYKNHQDVFLKSILGGSYDEPRRFWDAMEGNPAYTNHPVSKRAKHKTHAIPLVLHGDAVSTSGCGKSWAKSCDAYSWTSILAGNADALTSSFLIWLFFGKLLLKQSGNLNAFKAFERKLTWSLYWLMLGRWPTRDEHGREYPKGSSEWKLAHEVKWLANGFFGVLWLLVGDLEHMYKAWGFPSPTSIGHDSKACACCGANGNDADKPWTDGRLDQAKWVPTIYTNATWEAAFPDRSHIFKNLPGTGIEQYMPDLMHVLHLGVYQYIFASILALLTHHHMPDEPEKNLDVVWGHIKDYYKESVLWKQSIVYFDFLVVHSINLYINA